MAAPIKFSVLPFCYFPWAPRPVPGTLYSELAVMVSPFLIKGFRASQVVSRIRENQEVKESICVVIGAGFWGGRQKKTEFGAETKNQKTLHFLPAFPWAVLFSDCFELGSFVVLWRPTKWHILRCFPSEIENCLQMLQFKGLSIWNNWGTYYYIH